MYKNFFLLLIFLFSILTGCRKKDTDIEILLNWMTGSFSSEEQAKSDTNYYDIRLEMVQIWKDRSDGPWIYVEQAVADYKDKPYRQRIYQLVQENDVLKSVVYSIENPLRFAGEYQNENALSQLTPDSLQIREGCAVYLERTSDDTFLGSTKEKECVSNLRGATYATSEVTIKNDRILSWDRGFDSNDAQVWGAEKGGYIFLKLK
jgi:CpeT protein